MLHEMHWKRVGSAENAKRIGYCPSSGLCHDRDFSVTIEFLLAPCRDSGFSVATGVGLSKCFWVATRVFWVAIEPPSSMSRHGFQF